MRPKAVAFEIKGKEVRREEGGKRRGEEERVRKGMQRRKGQATTCSGTCMDEKSRRKRDTFSKGNVQKNNTLGGELQIFFFFFFFCKSGSSLSICLSLAARLSVSLSPPFLHKLYRPSANLAVVLCLFVAQVSRAPKEEKRAQK